MKYAMLLMGILGGYMIGWGQMVTFDKIPANTYYGSKIIQKETGYDVFLDTGSGDFLFLSTDLEGNVTDTHTYGGSYIEFMKDAVKAKDGGYLMVGHTFSYPLPDSAADYFAFAVKADSLGNQEWQRVFSYPQQSDRINRFYRALATSDGGYLLAGIFIDSITYPKSALWLIKIDGLGNTEWESMDTTYRGGYYESIAMLEHPDQNGYYIATTSGDSADYTTFAIWEYHFLIKIDEWGNREWTRTHITENYDPFAQYTYYDMHLLPNNHLLLSGNRLYMETDLLGSPIWKQEQGIRGGFRISPMISGGYITCNQERIEHITSDGQVIWLKDFPDVISFRDIIGTQDGGILALAHTWDGSRLIKTDCEGNVHNPVVCSPTSLTPPATLAFSAHLQSHQLNLSLPTEFSGKSVELSLYDVTGKMLWVGNTAGAVNPVFQLATSLPVGVYVLQAKARNLSISPLKLAVYE